MTGIAGVIYRDWRQRITNVGYVFWDLFVPIAYLTMFGTGFDRLLGVSFVLDGQPLDYRAYLLPGVIAMTGFSVAMNTAWGFFMDKDSGIFYELLTYPITRRQFLVGKVCFNVGLSAVGAFLAVVLAVFAMNIEIRWEWLPLTALIIVVTTSGWFFLLSILAIRLRRMDAFNTLTSAAYIFLMFLSSMFYPLAELPSWFRFVAQINPMTWQVDLLRFTLLGTGAPALMLLHGVAFAIFTAVCLVLAARALDRAA